MEDSLKNDKASLIAADPIDTGNKAYLLVFLLGAGSLMPWNAVLSSFDYLDKQFWSKASFVYPLVWFIPVIFFQILMLKYGDRLSEKFRISISFILYTIFLGVILVFAAEFTGMMGFFVTLVPLLFLGCTNSVIQSSIFGLSGQFPEKFTNAVMAGQGAGGVLINVIRLACIFAFGYADLAELRKGMVIYLAITCVIMALCVVATIALCKLDYAKYYLNKKELDESFDIFVNEAQTPRLDDEITQERTRMTGDMVAPENQEIPNLERMASASSTGRSKMTVIEILKTARYEAFTVSFVFFITFCVFPGIALVPTNFSAIWAIVLVTIFNCCDTTGRFTAKYLNLFKTAPALALATACRSVFFVTFFLIAWYKDSTVGSNHVVWVVNMMFFGVSNGYLSTRGMMLAPAHFREKDRQMAGFVMAAMNLVGIILGALAAVPLGFAF